MRRNRRKIFIPTESTDKSTEDFTTTSFDNQDITKGEKKRHVDLAGLEQDVKELLKNPNTKISDLQGLDKERYERIKSTSQMLYNTDYYNCFFERISKYCIPGLVLQPGTVAGYLCGCLASKNFSDAPCSILCADALPFPKDTEGWKHCNHAVIWAKSETVTIDGKTTTRYNFTVIKAGTTPEEYDPAYLFIDAEDLHSFKGFTITDINNLKALNVHRVKVFGIKVTRTGTTYPQLYPNVINVSELKMRNSTSSSSLSGLGIVILIIIILIIVLLLFAGSRYWRSC